MKANKAIPFEDLKVGMDVFNSQVMRYQKVTRCDVGMDNTKIVFLDGGMYGISNNLYPSLLDYQSTQDNFKKSRVVAEAFLWGDLPPNITEEQLDLIISWIKG
jgi:hypothetical protein